MKGCNHIAESHCQSVHKCSLPSYECKAVAESIRVNKHIETLNKVERVNEICKNSRQKNLDQIRAVHSKIGSSSSNKK